MAKKEKDMHLGVRLKMARIARGLTQDELGRKVDKTRPLISHIEQTGKINMQTLQRICEVLDLDKEELLKIRSSDAAAYYNSAPMAMKEIRRLRDEIRILKELVETQKDIIRNLNEKLRTGTKTRQTQR